MSNIILCADDSKTMQTVAEITFRVSDYQYVGATSADEALDKARAQKPALILADAAMPDKDGYELCRAIKSDPGLADVPVIMMCGNSSAYDPARGADVGADGHLSKPWDTQSLLDKVAELLQGGAKGARVAAKPAAQASRPAVVTQPPILPASNPAAAAAQVPRTATMIGMPQPLEPEKPRPGQPVPTAAAASRPGVGPAVDNAQPLAAPLPPRLYAKPTAGKPDAAPVPAATPTPAAAPTPAARPATAPAAARPAVGAPIGRVATAPPTGAAAAGAAAGARAPARPTTGGVATGPAATPPVAAGPAARPAPAAAPAAAKPAAAAARPAAAATPAAAARPATAPAPAADAGFAAVGRPPMIRGQATRRSAAVEALLQGAVARGTAAVAQEAGLDPAGPEMRALLALSVDVVERIVWEVVPELAELIIRENLAELAAAKR